jgi:hypothetical protein
LWDIRFAEETFADGKFASSAFSSSGMTSESLLQFHCFLSVFVARILSKILYVKLSSLFILVNSENFFPPRVNSEKKFPPRVNSENV